MKKIKILLTFLCIMAGIGIMANSGSAYLLQEGDNTLFFKNFETVFDSAGNELNFDTATPPTLQIGDHFVGIIDVQEITVGGTSTWFKSGTEQLTGLFAQRIEAIYAPNKDPYDANNSLTHIVLGAPTVSTFNPLGGGSFTTGLTGDESMALYYDTGATLFESNGSIVNDVAKATDGSLWMTLGYNNSGTDDISDDDGYNYSHTAQLGTTVNNFTGENWAALNVYRNLFGELLTGDMNDPNENEIDNIIAGLLTDVYLSGEFEGNPDWLAETRTSPWVFASNDPAHIGIIPEPTTIFLFGSGLLCLAGFARRKTRNLS
ncbi:PEP-CTERM sorting domain-containing protein [Desulfobacula phenolica]|uniref:PEP-CTERM protein-sorting domain-containing protein n=1 Tax=Desulfobacula phenolica TaxID=90732 RepID=A0A1H2EQG4_9BACT|nr:PEP-CTERM sorting domain-containing protein [Desulfobacula phenolica]SDT97366.1 PEP-CTERM protein-sorting domain-containing protein [Desulfobacula phenolica]